MDDDGPILTANSHGDNILCNKQVPTPLLIDDQQPDDNTMTIIEDINKMDTSSGQTTIIPLSQHEKVQENQEALQVSKYHAFIEFLIVELNKIYDLRPRPGPGRPPKEPPKIEPHTKVVETRTTTI